MPSEKIYVAGHRGMVGSAIVRALEKRARERSESITLVTRTHAELDLCNQAQVQDFFAKERPTQVYLAAAKVGGIYANNIYPAEFIYENLMMQANVIDAAYRACVKKLLFLGSSCIYPKLAPQPMAEDALLTGLLEPTNEPYAIAKIAGIKLCESYNRQYGCDYRSVMPTNLYGPGDNYDLDNSHVLPAILRKCHLAKLAMAGDLNAIRADEEHYGLISTEIYEMLGLDSRGKCRIGTPTVKLWGSGAPYREFLHVDDMASASVFVMNLDPVIYRSQTQPMQSHLNAGLGSDITIAELAHLVAKVVGYGGSLEFDASKPDGTPRKLMNSQKLKDLGWYAQIDLEAGIRSAYDAYLRKR